jgi:hypothetical protein
VKIGRIKFEINIVGRLVVVIDVNPSHGFWTARLIKVFVHEGQCTCIYNNHEWIIYIIDMNKKKKLKKITTSHISKKKIKVNSFALIVKE